MFFSVKKLARLFTGVERSLCNESLEADFQKHDGEACSIL